MRTWMHRGSTVLLLLSMAMSGLATTRHAQPIAETFERLELPLYLATLLGLCKLAAALGLGLGLVTRRWPRLQEWVYAGIFFNLAGAVVCHLSAGDPPRAAISLLVLLGLWAASYGSRPAPSGAVAPALAAVGR